MKESLLLKYNEIFLKILGTSPFLNNFKWEVSELVNAIEDQRKIVFEIIRWTQLKSSVK